MSYLDKPHSSRLWFPYATDWADMPFEDKQRARVLNSVSNRRYYLFDEIRERFSYNPNTGALTLKTFDDPNNQRYIRAKGLDIEELGSPGNVLLGITMNKKGSRSTARMSVTLGPRGHRETFKFGPAYFAAVLQGAVEAEDPVVASVLANPDGLPVASHDLYIWDNIRLVESDHLRRYMNPANMSQYLRSGP